MHSIGIISAIMRGKWLLDPGFALTQGPVISSILDRNLQIQKQEPDPLSAFAVSAADPSAVKYSWLEGFDRASRNSVAVVSLKGPLMKQDQPCGPLGMATIGRIIREADDHPNITGMVLHIDSPGGTVDGTESLASIIKNTGKPVVSFVDGQMTSAALWIGSAADEIMASTDTDEIGSIGVMMSFADLQPYYEKQGVKFHAITASTSPEKIQIWEDLRQGNYESYIKEILDPLDEKFMGMIRENRPKVEDKHLTGKVFFARQVMGILADAIGSLEDAIKRVSELAASGSRMNSTNETKKYSMEQYQKLNAVLGVDSLESADDHVTLNTAQLELIEKALATGSELASQKDQAITEKKDALQLRDKANQELSDAMEAFNAIDPVIAQADTPGEKAGAIRSLLAARPGTQAEGNLDKQDPAATEPQDANWEAIDNLTHNKDADQNL